MNFLITKGIEVQDQVCASAQLVGKVLAPLLTLRSRRSRRSCGSVYADSPQVLLL
jgi:hypothetical protein